MGKEYAPWSETRPTISHAVKKPELTLLWEEFNNPAVPKGGGKSVRYENHAFLPPPLSLSLGTSVTFPLSSLPMGNIWVRLFSLVNPRGNALKKDL